RLLPRRPRALVRPRFSDKAREGEVEERLLLDRVGLRGTGRGARARRAADGPEASRAREPSQDRPDEAQPSHVRRLLLHPDEFRRLGMAGQLLRKLVFRERIELLEANDGNAGIAALL